MRIRWYVDEDAMDSDLVDALRLRGVDILTVVEAVMRGRDDPDQLAFAAQQGRMLYSFNARDFVQWHALYLNADQSHAGIVLAPQQQWSVGEQMRRLLRIMAALSAEEMNNRLEWLSAWGDDYDVLA